MVPFAGVPRVLAALPLILLALAGCGNGDDAPEDMDEPSSTVTIAGVGFATPESVLHDTEADVYLVSNINGGPLDKDGNGFISRVSPEGDVIDLRWIDGEADGVTLHAPKGMAVQGSTLFVTDIDCVRRFDRASGEPTGEVCPQNVSFLNDIAAAPDGTSLFFTDTGLDASFAPTGTDAVYRLSEGDRVTVLIRDPDLGAPNGVAVGNRGIFVVTFMSGEVFRLDAEGNRTDVMPGSEGQYDGIEMMDDGGFLLSSWGDQAVYRVAGDGSRSRVLSGVDAPADIGVDRMRNRVLVPLFNADEVRVVPLP
jgi:hypothetical protein